MAPSQASLPSFSFRGKSLPPARFCSWPQKICGSQHLRRRRSEEAPPTEIPTEEGEERGRRRTRELGGGRGVFDGNIQRRTLNAPLHISSVAPTAAAAVARCCSVVVLAIGSARCSLGFSLSFSPLVCFQFVGRLPPLFPSALEHAHVGWLPRR